MFEDRGRKFRKERTTDPWCSIDTKYKAGEEKERERKKADRSAVCSGCLQFAVTYTVARSWLQNWRKEGIALERLKRKACRGGNRGGRERGRERKKRRNMYRVPNLFEGRRSAKKLVDEIETKYVFRWGEIAMLVDRRREGKIISIVSTLLREEDLWREREGGEKDSWMKLKRKACFVVRSRALVG